MTPHNSWGSTMLPSLVASSCSDCLLTLSLDDAKNKENELRDLNPCPCDYKSLALDTLLSYLRFPYNQHKILRIFRRPLTSITTPIYKSRKFSDRL